MVDLDELERLLQQATAGPWVIDWNVSRLDIFSSDETALVTSLRRSALSPAIDEAARTNARLIAALRNAAEELIRDARRWRDHEELLRRVIRIEEGM